MDLQAIRFSYFLKIIKRLMRNKIKEAVMHWRNKRDADTNLEFVHTKEGEDKNFKARITADDTGNAAIELISFNGYNEKYVKRQLSHYMNLFNTDLQTDIGSGDVILTRYADVNPPKVGSVVTISKEINYYAVNNSIIYCNGEELGKQWKAVYLGFLIETCDPDAEPVKYTKFKLQ